MRMADKENFIAYYRVSTRGQHSSGLGIDAQKNAVTAYLGARSLRVVADFVEVESGRRSDRPALENALTAARVHRAALIVAKVDRLTRSVAFLSRLLEAGIDVRFADLPAVEGPTGRFMLQQMAAVAELEAGMISSRTIAALAVAKSRGRRLGGFRGATLSQEARERGRAAQADRALRRARDLKPLLDELEAQGARTPAQLAQSLSDRAIPTARPGGRWSATQIARIRARLLLYECSAIPASRLSAR